MDMNVLKGRWKQVRGEVERRWSRLTDDDLGRIEGDKRKLVGALQERYGHDHDKAAKEVDTFFDELASKISSD